MLGFLTSGVLGGITGLLGGVFNRVMDFKTLKVSNEFELSKLKQEEALLQMEIKRDVDMAKTEAAMHVDLGELEALKKSYDADKATYTKDGIDKYPWAMKGLALVDIVRGFTRPLLTLYLDIILTVIAVFIICHYMEIDKQLLTPADEAKMVVMILDAVIYLATTATGWWFGSRGKRVSMN